MTSRDEAFQPASIDEHVQQLKQAASQLDEISTPNTRLIQDLRIVHTDDMQSGQRVWERLAERMTKQNVQSNHLTLLTNEQLSTERSAYMRTEQSEIGPMPSIQPGKPPRKFRRMFTLVAALLVALLLVGGILVIITNMHPYGGTAAAPTSTAILTATAIPTATAGSSFPASDCPKTPGTPGPISASWYQLCQAGKFVTVNQTQHLTRSTGYSYDETIEAAYADRNMLFLFYDFSPIKATDMVANMFNAPITKQGLQLQESGGGVGFDGQNQHFTSVIGYDTSSLPANLQTLTVKVNSSVSVHSRTAGGAGSQEKTSFAFFDVPLHSGQILTSKQTISANGAAITLTKTVIAASGVHLIFSASPIPGAALRNGFNGTLQANKAKAFLAEEGLISSKGGMIVTGFELIFENNLSSEHGVWTLTITSRGEPQPWIFHFTVAA